MTEPEVRRAPTDKNLGVVFMFIRASSFPILPLAIALEADHNLRRDVGNLLRSSERPVSTTIQVS